MFLLRYRTDESLPNRKKVELISELAALLSAAWAQPDNDFARALTTRTWQKQLMSLTNQLELGSTTKIQSAVEVLARSIRSSPPVSGANTLLEPELTSEYDSLMVDLATEYAALYIGPNRPLVPAYECQWIDGEQASLFIAPTAVAVENCYRSAGVVMANNEPPDSLFVELEFVAHLARAEKYASTSETLKYSNWRQEFVASHVNKWAASFCDATERATEHGAYAAFSRITRAVIESAVLAS